MYKGAQTCTSGYRRSKSKHELPASEMKPGRWSKRKPGGERWVKPEMVVEIEFNEWTPGTCAPSFQGVRADKKAREVVREHS
jgi:bifunctional non-homologous end joining protein LigD